MSPGHIAAALLSSEMSIMESKSSHRSVVQSTGLHFYLESVRPDIEHGLLAHLPITFSQFGARFNEAVRYALFPGGKRLRPVLTFLGAELVGGNRASVLPAAVAVEYIHTSSLIFDDLPFMDNAKKRRGRLCLHLSFGDALAVLVALGLLNAAYGLIFRCAEVENALLIKAHHELVQCIGPQGMIAGQAIDIAAAHEAKAPSRLSDFHHRDRYEAVRNLKTSSMIRMALCIGAILSGASENQLHSQSRFALLLGDAFQISDDLLDLKEDASLSVATSRSKNIALERGAGHAKRRALGLVAEAKDVLTSEYGQAEPAQLLCEVADYVARRKA